MRKLALSIILLIIVLLSCGTIVKAEQIDTMDTNTASELIEMKEKTKSEIDEYSRKYGSEYGTVAYALNKVRIFSIPLCFTGIAIGALYQYVLGTRRLDSKHKGFNMIVAFITILVICQVLPLIFAIVIRGWGD